MRGLDFTPVLFAVMILFLGSAAFQFLSSWPTGHQGLLAFEKACHLHSMTHT
jgi:hypothetical protein